MSVVEEAREVGGRTKDATFDPVIGQATVGLGEYLIKNEKLKDQAAFNRVRDESLAIVRRCRPFRGPDGNRTGLVVGYVQSGKTMSMTTVAAVARDNGVRIVILLAGVTTNLLKQNAKRFRETLRGAAHGEDHWVIINSDEEMKKDDGGTSQTLRQAVEEWRESAPDDSSQRTLFFAVLKHHKHLEWLTKTLKSAKLSGVPAIVLDDEADQAGLNVRPNSDDASLTYNLIRRVRDALPHHTYLQYTATPQAPLLISIDDVLSPEFAELVEPGDGYTGGREFFTGQNERLHVVKVPEVDLFKPGEPPDEPPDSMKHALAVFFVGCAIARTRGTGPTPRSMLVHPSQRRSDHSRFLHWINSIIERWSTVLANPSDGDYSDVIDELRAGHAKLAETDPNIPALEALREPLLRSLRRVSTKQVNSEGGTEVDWENGQEHILVGGEKLNRGYTVEGLTVTYMPRDAGGWTADTLQQRARFFGYKRKYLALCRLYLHQDVAKAYRDYVVHEADVRKQLGNHRGKPLKEWRRAFFLDRDLQPTRRNVLTEPIHRIHGEKGWFIQRYPHLDPDAVAHNRQLLMSTRAGMTFKKGEFAGHGVAETSLKTLLEALLVAYRAPDQSDHWYAYTLALSAIVDRDADATATVLEMDSGRVRKRTPEKDAVTLLQGRSSARDKDGAYKGDAAMIALEKVTVQLHLLNVDGVPGAHSVPALAVHIPKHLLQDVAVQERRK